MMNRTAFPYSSILIFTWLFVQAFLFFKYGVHTDLESTKYIGQANNLLETGSYSAPKYFFYSTLIFIIAFFVKTTGSYVAVALFQTALNGVATVVLFKLGKALFKNNRTAFIATLLFILFFPLQHWNVYLYTESVFISLSILFAYVVYRYPPVNLKNCGIGLAFILLLVVTRPFGVLYILPYFLYALLVAPKSLKKGLYIAALLGSIAFFMLINYAFKGGEDMDAMKPFREEHIICFIPDPNPAVLDLRDSGKPVADIFYYISHNPFHFFKLMTKRIFSFFILSKPHFSFYHNVYLLFATVPVYLFALLAVWKGLLRHPLFKFALLLTVLYSLGTTFQCNDYHNRFIMPLFAYLFLPAAAGINFIVEKLLKGKTA